MEPNDVLKRFVDVCSNKDGSCSRNSFASNGILQWFGRSVKDSNNIFDYIRYNISLQYEHIFSVAIRCEAFEETPSHKATRSQPSDTVASIATSKCADIYETPPSCSVPKESDDMCTPEKKVPPYFDSSNKKVIYSETDDETITPKSTRVTRSARKRNSRSQNAYQESPTKRNKSNGEKDSKQLTVSCAATNETQDVSKISEPFNVREIKYIEAIGTVRKLRKLKHRGIDSRSKDIRIYESPTRNHWDMGNTKIQISYRENVNQCDLQFVLAIYDHIEKNPRCRRDLMTDFAKTCNDKTSQPSSESQKTNKKGKPSKSLKMRRLRF